MTNFDIMPVRYSITAMLRSGFKTAAHAIAEIVDNAIQAHADLVEIVCKEKADTNRNTKEIAVIDNGCGMNETVLRSALQFGVGERLSDRSGIGRFGMGLPNSSISQANRVEVYSWQNGVENSIYSYLDVAEIQQGSISQVPEPIKKLVPQEWLKISATAGTSKSGTIVIWQQLDRCKWKTANAIFRNSEFFIGRIYRRFIQSKKVRVRMTSFTEGNLSVNQDNNVVANDPLYLMSGTSTPDRWANEPMFEQIGPTHVIDWDGHKVKITCSMAKKEARVGDSPGRRTHGSHARDNIGVSIMRADREIDLQRNGWVISYDPVERWWGAEIDFPPALDEIFGVPNNKQGADDLAEFASVSLDELAEREGYKNQHEMQQAWEESNEPRLLLLKIRRYLDSNIASMRNNLTAQKIRSRTRHENINDNLDSAEARGTQATIMRRQEEGVLTQSDKDEKRPQDERSKLIQTSLIDDGFSNDEAEEKTRQILSDGRKYEFYDVDIPSAEFFTVRPKGGVILIGLNTNHPAHRYLVSVMRNAEDIENVEELKGTMKKSYEGLKLLLEAWARYEDELSDGTPKDRARDARYQWGIVARDFFRED